MKYKNLIPTTSLFYLLAGVLIAIRFFIVVTHFNFILTDNDQALFWYGCHNFSKGLYYTPFIYGCDYGSMLESFMALPFYKFGMPLYYALPFSNTFWIFILCAILGYNLNLFHPKHHTGSLFLLFLTLLPTDYYAILFAAKGHLAGILPVLVSLILVTRWKTKPILILAGLLAGLGFLLNPNSVFVILLLFLFIPNLKSILFAMAGMASSLFYLVITSHYAQILDSELLHKQWKLTFVMSFFKNHIPYLDKYLNTVTPIFGKMGFISLLLPLILAIVLFSKKDWIKGSVALLFVFMLLASFGFSKVSDGSVDLFFPYCRFYLALAFCNALFIPLLFQSLQVNNYYKILMTIPFIISVYFISKTPVQATALAHKPGETYAVQRKFVADIVSHTYWMKQRINETKQTRPMIVATDYIYYSENLLLSTMDLPHVTCCFENYKQFYWLANAMKNKKQSYDLFIILSFEDRFARKSIQYPQYLHRDNVANYFLIPNVRQPARFIDDFLR
ncbi:MAG: hypothetical protein ACKVQB_07695 [Bacteroidia bacterium]